MSRPQGFAALLVLICLGLFAYGCGGDDDGATQEQIDAAKEEGAREAREQAKLDQLEKQVKELRNQANGNGGSGNSSNQNGSGGATTDTSGPVSTCDTGIQVGPNTSCAFAFNVAGEYGSNPGATQINAYSPVTGEYYTMSCGPFSGGGTVCTGGNGAAVYLP